MTAPEVSTGTVEVEVVAVALGCSNFILAVVATVAVAMP